MSAAARYKATVSYVGTAFHGWQVQKNAARTVQAVLSHALSSLARASVRVEGASRTDAGVHAEGQVVHFDLPRRAPPEVDPRRGQPPPARGRAAARGRRRARPTSTRGTTRPGRSTSTAGPAPR